MGYQAEASAVGALALGAQAFSRGGNATALGTATRAIGVGSSAFGYGSWATGAGSISIGGEANGTNPGDTGPNVNSTNAAAADAIAIGSQARVNATTSTSGIAIGRGANVNGAYGIAQGDGVVSGAIGQNVAIGSSSTTANSSTAAGGAVAIGRGQTATGNGAVAIGDPNTATGTGAIALGAENTANGQGALAQGNANNATGQGALALGNVNNANGQGALALGSGNTASGQGAVALGNASSAALAGAVALGDGAQAIVARSVALGSGSTTAAAVGTASTVIRGATYNFAGTTPTSTVSVGTAGAERTVTNVAAGRLSGTSTDAVNGSQLFATNQAVQAAGAGFTLTAQGANGSNVDPSESIDLKGGDGNIVVSKAGTDNNVNFDLADDITVNSVVAGNSRLDTTGLTITGGPSVTAAGINAGNKVISNVAAGVAATDAVNKSQLDAVGAVANTGFNVTAQGANSSNVAPGEAVDFKNTDGNIAVSKTGANNDVNFDLADDITVNSVVAGNSRLDNTGLTIAGGPSVTSAGINAGNQVVSNVAAGVAATDAVNKSQLDAVSGGSTALGMNFTGNDAAAGVVHRDLGQTLSIRGDAATAGAYSGANVKTVTDPATGAINVQLAESPKFGSVTINDGGTGKIAGVTAADLSAASADAVNGSQLFQTNQDVAALGNRVTANEGDIAAINAVVGPTDPAYQTANGNGVRYVRTNAGGNAQSDAFATGANSTAVGYNARAAADETIAIGENALANSLSGLALGSGSESTAQYAIAIGDESTASGDFSLALGDTAIASGSSSIATGLSAQASASGAVAMGAQARASGTSASALGTGAEASATTATAIGSGSIATNMGSVALGSDSVADGATLGEAAYVPTDSTYAVAAPFALSEVSIGKAGSERRLSNVAAGAVDTDAVNVSQLKAVDSKIASLGEDSLLWDPTANGGAGAYSANHLGSGPNKIVNVAPADLSAASTDAVNGSQLFQTNQNVAALSNRVTTNEGDIAALNTVVGPTDQAYQDANGRGVRYVRTNDTGQVQSDAFATAPHATAVGYGARASNVFATAIGSEAVSSGNSSIAIGKKAAATFQNTIAIGDDTIASGDGSIAFGNDAVADKGYAAALGDRAKATAQGATALGSETEAIGEWATAVGESALAAGNSSAALGALSSVTAAYGTVLGAEAEVSHAGSVALGAHSVADGATLGTAAYVPPASTYAVAGTTPTAEVSLGTAGQERRVTNLAAGATDTDAVNVSQLKAVDSKITALGQDSLLWDPAANGGAGAFNANHGGTGPNKIVNVAPADLSAASTDAVNGSQLFATNQAVQAAGAGFTLTAQGANGSNVDPSESIDLKNGDGNIVVSKAGTDNNVNFDLADDITVDSVVAGNSRLDNTGLTIAGGPSVTSAGINAGNQVVSNVAAGVAATDAVNKSQLDAVSGGSTTLGMNFTGNDNAAGDVHRDLGQTLSIRGDAATAGSYSGANLKTVTDPTTGAINVQLAESPKFGNVVINDGGAGKITGVTAADLSAASTDAVNGSQLFQTNQTVAGLDSRVTATEGNVSNLDNRMTTAEGDITNLDNRVTNVEGQMSSLGQDALKWDPAANGGAGAYSATHGGTAPNKIVNVAAADLSAASTDAVNGSQLFQTNQNVAGLDSRVTTAEGDITNLDNRVTNNEGAITNLQNQMGPTDPVYLQQNGRGTRYARTNDSGLPEDDAHAQGVGATALGYNAVSSAADAVAIGRGAQASHAGSVALGAGSVADGSTLGNAAYLTGGTATGEVNIGNRRLTGVAAGANDTDAVNVAQLKAVSTSAAQAEQRAVKYDWTDSNGNGQIDPGEVDFSKATLAGPASTDGGVTGGSKLTNLAQGEVSATSTDAVNGAQLYAVAGQSDAAYVAQNGRGLRYARSNDSGLAEADAHAQGVGSSAVGYNATAAADNAVAVGREAVASHANSVALGAGSATTAGAQSGYNGAYVGSSNSTGQVQVGGRTLGGLAAGSAADDAVNVAQLQAGVNDAVTQANSYTDARVAQVAGNVAQYDNRISTVEGDVNSVKNGAAGLFQVSQDNHAAPTASGSNAAAGGAGAVASGNGSTALGNGANASGNNAVALGAGSVADQANTVSMGSAGGERRVTNIAAGVADTDAVNVSQLKGFTTGGVQYDKNADGSNNANSLTFNPNGSGQTTLHNVAAGTAATDAVNVGQLQGGIKDAVVQANGYTDGQVAAVRNDVWKLGGDVRRLERDMQSGIATAIAIKPAPYVAGRTTYYAGFGAYKSQAAFGVSLRRTADSGRWSVEGGASSNRDGTGVYLGVSGVLGD
ncbi:hypothetical protein ACI2IY_05480 [Lysobacter enzymogenes]|uniref:hypothetical protein n=1 Tax=Lysobacter enzymogenes TaxID=69 RepID=UPI00384F0BF4